MTFITSLCPFTNLIKMEIFQPWIIIHFGMKPSMKKILQSNTFIFQEALFGITKETLKKWNTKSNSVYCIILFFSILFHFWKIDLGRNKQIIHSYDCYSLRKWTTFYAKATFVVSWSIAWRKVTTYLCNNLEWMLTSRVFKTAKPRKKLLSPVTIFFEKGLP